VQKASRSNSKAGAGHGEGVQEALRTAQKARLKHPGPPKKHAGDTQGVTSEMTEAPKPQKRFSCQLRTHFGLRFGLHFCAESMVLDDFLNEAFCMRSEVTPSGSANTKRRFGLRLEVSSAW
jgi:hypothetical protein